MRSMPLRMAIVGAALALAVTDAAAQCAATSIPLPSRALLLTPAKFTCTIDSSSLGTTPDQTKSDRAQIQPDAGSGITLAMRLDYERQCHRHAVIILREAMQQLQASLGETFRAIKNSCPAAAVRAAGPGSSASVALADKALLAPSPEFNCEFNASSPNSSAGLSPPGTPSGRSDGELAMKLDYERQCYRHAEIILRDELQLLQSSVGEMIKAVNSNRSAVRQPPAAKEPPAAKGSPAAKGPPAAKQSHEPKQSVAAQSALAAKPSPAPKRPAAPKQQADSRKQPSSELAPCVFDGAKCIGRDPDPHIRSMIYNDREL